MLKLKSYHYEFIGTFFLVLIGCGSIRLMDTGFIQFPYAPDLAFGLILVLCISLLAPRSGAHYNPAVSLGFLLLKEINFKTFKYYVTFQVAGALLACTLLKTFIPESTEFGATIPRLNTASVFFLEIILTAILVSVIFMVALVKRTTPLVAGIFIGGTVSLCSYFAGPYTGASMNPARTFGPNLFQGQSHVIWLYLLAPSIGGILTALFFHYFILKKKKN